MHGFAKTNIFLYSIHPCQNLKLKIINFQMENGELKILLFSMMISVLRLFLPVFSLRKPHLKRYYSIANIFMSHDLIDKVILTNIKVILILMQIHL